MFKIIISTLFFFCYLVNYAQAGEFNSKHLKAVITSGLSYSEFSKYPLPEKYCEPWIKIPGLHGGVVEARHVRNDYGFFVVISTDRIDAARFSEEVRRFSDWWHASPSGEQLFNKDPSLSMSVLRISMLALQSRAKGGWETRDDDVLYKQLFKDVLTKYYGKSAMYGQMCLALPEWVVEQYPLRSKIVMEQP